MKKDMVLMALLLIAVIGLSIFFEAVFGEPMLR